MCINSRGCGNAGVWDRGVVVSAGHVGGTRGSGIVSSEADVRGMRGVGGVCEMCVFGSGRSGRRSG